MKNYTLYKIRLWSLAKVGFLVGWAASFFPVALASFMFFKLVDALATWLSGQVYRLSLPLPGNFGIDINLVELLKLQGLMARLDTWNSIGFIATILIVLLVTSFLALFWGLVVVAGGLLFNLISQAIGGIQFSMTEEKPAPDRPTPPGLSTLD
jgi:hypothetical protein